MSIPIDRRSALAAAAGVAVAAQPALARKRAPTATNRRTIDAYVAACIAKDLEGIGRCLSDDVQFIGPMAEFRGRETVLQSFSKIFHVLEKQVQRGIMVEGSKALMFYDFVCAPPIGLCRTAEYDELVDGKIVRIELFYDARPFEAALKARQS